MKIKALLILLTLTTISVAQSHFEMSYNNLVYQKPAGIIELDDGGHAMAVTANDGEVGVYYGMVMKINNNGEFIKLQTIEEYDNCTVHNIIKYNDNNVVICTIEDDDVNYIGLLTVNKNVEVVDRYLYEMPKNLDSYYLLSTVSTDNHIIITGNYKTTDTSIKSSYIIKTELYNTPSIYKEVDQYVSNYLTNQISDTTFAVTYDDGSNFSGAALVILNNNLEEIEEIDLTQKYLDFMNISNQYEETDLTFCDIAFLDNGSYIVSGYEKETYNLLEAKFNENDEIVALNIIASNQAEEDLNMWAIKNSSISTEDSFYTLYVSNFDAPGPYYSTDNSPIQLRRYDSDMNMAWEKTFNPTDANVAHSIYHTSDDCILVLGSYYDYENAIADERNLYLLKVNTDGELLWTKEIDIDQNFHIYPNPSIDYISYSGNNDGKWMELFSTNGNMCKRANLNNGEIDISSLAAGVYIYKVINKEGEKVAEGKLIKE